MHKTEQNMETLNSFIKLEHVNREYDNGIIKALIDINLEIKKGEFISIIGPSGSGKSTLLNMIGALDSPTSGKIIIDNQEVTNNKTDLDNLRSQKIGFIFQLHNLIPNFSVFENVQIPLITTKISEKETEKRAKQLLNDVGLSDKLNQKPTKLSGGQRQRVAIARALINEPTIILADEPTGALDTKTGNKIIELLKEIHEKRNVTLIIVTHNPQIAQMADRIIEITDGKIQ